MSRKLIVNGEYDASRLGASKYGTFWSAVQPPLPDSCIELCTNKGFEVNLTGWTSAGNHTGTRSTGDFWVGVACAEVVATGAGGPSDMFYFTTTLVNTKSYKIMFYAKSVSGNTTINFLNDSGSVQSFTLTSGWSKFTVIFTSNSAAPQALRFYLSGAGTFRLDEVTLVSNVNTTYALDQSWGERLVENSGRVRGLSGVGTIPATTTPGTFTMVFPVSYFAHTPIVDLFMPRSVILDGQSETVDDTGHYVTKLKPIYGNFIVNDPYVLEYYYVNPAYNGFVPDNVTTYNSQTPPWIMARQIGSNGFLVTNITVRSLARTYWNIPVPFYWHAFGV